VVVLLLFSVQEGGKDMGVGSLQKVSHINNVMPKDYFLTQVFIVQRSLKGLHSLVT